VFPIKNKTSIVLLFGVVLGFHLTLIASLGSAIWSSRLTWNFVLRLRALWRN